METEPLFEMLGGGYILRNRAAMSTLRLTAEVFNRNQAVESKLIREQKGQEQRENMSVKSFVKDGCRWQKRKTRQSTSSGIKLGIDGVLIQFQGTINLR